MKQVKAIALFSGGLDSILACRVIQSQGIEVQAVKFVTPFFGYELLANKAGYKKRMARLYGIDVTLVDISGPYFTMLRDPVHGYGKNFNPCLDCKILLVSAARRIMEEQGADFLISGEVVGQRPMSQRRDTLRVVERNSDCDGLLLRPLCARHLPPTRPELEGLVDRDRLYAMKGRGRREQMALAESFGIRDYPSPGGGCILTDPIQSQRIRRFVETNEKFSVDDMRFLLEGRQFRLPAGGWLAIGRNEKGNQRLLTLARPGDLLLNLVDRPGPTGLLRYCGSEGDTELAAGIVLRYAGNRTRPAGPENIVVHDGQESRTLAALPLADEECRKLAD